MKYPNLRPIDQSCARRTVVSDVRSVAARVGCEAWYDCFRDAFVFGLNTGDGVVVLYDIIVGAGKGFDVVSGWEGRFGDRGVDGAVRYLNWSKIDPREKARMREQHEKAVKRDERDELKRKIEAYKPEFRSRDKFQDKKMGMGKHYKGLVTVP